MDNSIYFYNIGFDRGSNVQPYFVSDMARDSYFSSLDAKQINKDGVNIKLEYDFYITIKANIDAVYMDSYNFAVVTYNERKYYCDIIDYEHISVNRSRVILRRNMLYEITDYLSNFQDFMISRLNYDYNEFTIQSALLADFNFRYYNTFNYFSWKSYEDEDIVFKNFSVIFLNSDCLRPSNGELTIYFPNVNNPVGVSVTTTLQGENRNIGVFLINMESANSNLYLRELLQSSSPYVIGIQRIVLPCVLRQPNNRYTPVGTYFGHLVYKNSANNVEIPGYIPSSQYPIIRENVGYIWNPMSDFQIKASVSVNPFNRLIILLGNTENRIDLECYKYGSDDSFNINIEMSILLDPNCSYYGLTVKTNSSNSYVQNTPLEKYVMPINTAFSYPETTEAKWYAENKYYDALTKNAIRASIANGTINTLENFSVGGSQIGLGFVSNGLEKPFREYSLDRTAASLGAGNAVRGVFEIGHTINNAAELYNQRKLQAQNERAKPDSFSSGDITSSYYFSLNGYCGYILQIPFDEDLNEYKNYILKYGAEVEMYRENFNYLNFIDSSNQFVLKAVAYKKIISKLTNAQYEELYRYLQAGFKYQVIGV